MAHKADSTTQTNTAPQTALSSLRGHVYTMAAAFAGVIFGVLGSMGFVGNYLNSQFAAQNSAMEKRIVSFAPSASYGACTNPTAAVTSAHLTTSKSAVAAAAAPVHEVGGKGGDMPTTNGGSATGGSHAPFVTQMVNGTIANTGPGSKNVINGTNNYSATTTNNNTVSVSNNSTQKADSGNTNVSGNTTGGSADSGDATNHNATSTLISIDN